MTSFIENLQWRRAAKTFDTSQPAPDIEPIVRSINEAPSSFGLQPYKVIVVTDPALKQSLRSLSYDQPQTTECSHLLVFCYDTDVSARIDTFRDMVDLSDNEPIICMARNFVRSMHDDELHSWARAQTYIALGFALAAAAERKISSCPMEGFLSDAYKETLRLPDNLRPCVLLAVGPEATPQTMYPRFRFYDVVATHTNLDTTATNHTAT
jgi:nitroreductase / dihydropteridine reductase